MIEERKTILKLPKRVGITEDAHIKLSELRKATKKSRAQIVIELINKEYEANR